jgi:hypothetical protein
MTARSSMKLMLNDFMKAVDSRKKIGEQKEL